MTDLERIYYDFMDISADLDAMDEVLADIDLAELKDKGLELVHAAGYFSKELHELVMRYDPSFKQYHKTSIVPYRFPSIDPMKVRRFPEDGEDDSKIELFTGFMGE